MGKIIVSLNCSLDGFCNHDHVIAEDEHHAKAILLLKTSEAVLFGRKTFQLFESFWPNAVNDDSLPLHMRQFASEIDTIQKFVFSKTLKKTDWKNSSILNNITPSEITDLKRKFTGKLLILGSPTIVSEFSKLNLIDEYHFNIQPIISGKGVRLFSDPVLENHKNMKLINSQVFKSGVLSLTYQNNYDE